MSKEIEAIVNRLLAGSEWQTLDDLESGKVQSPDRITLAQLKEGEAMTKPKHTPGPWRARCRHVDYNGGPWDENEFLQWEVEGPRVPWGRGDFHQADAYLVAAAPDMYEAALPFEELIQLLLADTGKNEPNYLIAYAFNSKTVYITPAQGRAFLAALAKARGEKE